MVEADLDIMPLMNLFVVLIPMLLLSAVFIELSSIEMNLPSPDATASTPKQRLELAVTIADEAYVVEGRGLRRQKIERDADAAYDELQDTLETIASGHPDNKEIVIVSPGDTEYQELITVMDISREAGMPAISLVGASAR